MKAFYKNWRFLVLLAVFGLSFSLLIFRAFQLQLNPERRVAKVADGQFERTLTTRPKRASIYDRNGRTLAVSVSAPSVFLDPSLIKNSRLISKKLSTHLGMSEKEIRTLIHKNKKKKFIWLKRQVKQSVADNIQGLNLRGVGLVPEFRREYVLGKMASSVLGFVSSDGRGLGGVESSYQKLLAGEKNEIQIKRDAKGRPLFGKISNVSGRAPVKSLYLTIDVDLQYLVEKYLSQAMLEHQSQAGVAIVMNPKNGELLALADLPNFDPNNYSDYPASYRRVRAITDPVEPASVLKIFGVGEAIERGLVNSRSVIKTPEKVVRIGRKIIRDAEKKHEQVSWTVADLIKLSSNVATVKLMSRLGSDALGQVYDRAGFSEKTGIDLPGESRGIFTKWDSSRKLEWATMSFGQGIALTPMQVVRSFAAIANGGNKVSPHVLKYVEEELGVRSYEQEADFNMGKLWSDSTLEEVKKLLKAVVTAEGTGSQAQIPGYFSAGKTGTAQKVDFKNGGYKKSAYWSSFVGFVPVDDPKLVIYVMLDEPKGRSFYGGVVAAPVFSSIAKTALRSATVQND